MREPGRFQSAIDLLTRINMGRIPMDATIRDFMAQRRFIGSKDRTAIVERVYRAMRAHARLSWWMAQKSIPDTARARLLADFVLSDKPSDEDIFAIFSGEKHAPDVLGEDEQIFIAFLQGKNLSDGDMPPHVRVECPDWAMGKLQSRFGHDFEAQMAAMIPPAPLDLRVNTIKSDVNTVTESLKKDHIAVQKTRYSPIGLRAHGKPFMSDSKIFREGHVEIQDEGSQLIGLLTGAKPGMRVLDFCAGGGGKTLVMAAMMQNKGNIVAMDNDKRRLEKGRVRYKKAGVHNIEVRSLEEEQHRKWLRRQKGTMDVVLVDAPCSSSGTWRRNPDLRWKFYGPSLDDILKMQAEILDKVAEKVKNGGRLVYATCSLFSEENEDQVFAFLARHPDFKILPLKDAWNFMTPIPCEGDFMRLTPKDHETDGFFAAILEKQ